MSGVTYVLGAGVAGLTAQKRLLQAGIDCVVLEKSSRIGGHAKVHNLGGYLFDEGPHLLFGDDEFMSSYTGAPGVSEYSRKAVVKNFWNGKLMGHPAHLDFKAMVSPNIVESVAESLLSTRSGDEKDGHFHSYEEWLRRSQGDFVYQNFSKEYTLKYWRLHPKEMTSDWAGKRVHVLTALQRESIKQARDSGSLHLKDFTLGAHYLTSYTYHPKGFWALFPGLHGSRVSLNSEVQALNLENRKILVNGSWAPYENLISTIPLDKLLRMSSLTMFDSSRILVTSFLTLNIVVATSQAPQENEAHWMYLYDDDIPVSRVSFPDRFTEETATQGPRYLRIQGEAYFLRGFEDIPKVTPTDLFDYLKGNSLIPSDAALVYQASQTFDHGNVVPTLGSEQALSSIKSFLSSNGIYVAGRYGAWEYLWTLEAARSGFKAAEKLIRTEGTSG